jgi:hypothetical protein
MKPSVTTPNYAMQRSALVVTPLAGTASGFHRFPPASGAPTARGRSTRTLGILGDEHADRNLSLQVRRHVGL